MRPKREIKPHLNCMSRGGVTPNTETIFFFFYRIKCLNVYVYIKNYLQISHALSVLDWYIPGLSELPLGNRLPLFFCRAFPGVLCLLHFYCHFRFFFPFFFCCFVSCACVYSEHGTAGEPGAVAGVSGCWRVEGGLQGARLAFSWLRVACASRHEGCMNGLCLASICDFG